MIFILLILSKDNTTCRKIGRNLNLRAESSPHQVPNQHSTMLEGFKVSYDNFQLDRSVHVLTNINGWDTMIRLKVYSRTNKSYIPFIYLHSLI
jgi:hypothetical protein